MNINKKGIHSHVIIILLSSVIMTILFLTLFNSVFKNDHIKCQDINYKIIKSEKTDSGLKITLKNDMNVGINFDIQSDSVKRILLPKLSVETFSVKTDDKVDIIPIYITSIGKEEFSCRGKTQSINLDSLMMN